MHTNTIEQEVEKPRAQQIEAAAGREAEDARAREIEAARQAAAAREAEEARARKIEAARQAAVEREFESIYLTVYGEERLKDRPFLNMGAGSFTHKYWRTSDRLFDGKRWMDIEAKDSKAQAPTEIEHYFDYTQGTPLNIPDNFLEVVYTSHSLEHTYDQFAQFALKEAFRVLKPGGILRVTVPDAEMAFDAARRNDAAFFGKIGLGKSLPIMVSAHVSLVFQPEYDGKLKKADIVTMFAEQPFEVVMDQLYEASWRVYEKTGDTKGKHVNWYNFDKMARLIRKAGFSTIYRSGYSQSACPILRDTRYFDTTRPNRSLYVEAVK